MRGKDRRWDGEGSVIGPDPSILPCSGHQQSVFKIRPAQTSSTRFSGAQASRPSEGDGHEAGELGRRDAQSRQDRLKIPLC